MIDLFQLEEQFGTTIDKIYLYRNECWRLPYFI